MLTCAFIYIAPGLDPLKQHAVIPSEDVPMYVVGCSSYEQAETVAAALAKRDVSASIFARASVWKALPGSNGQQDRTLRSAWSDMIPYPHSETGRGMNYSNGCTTASKKAEMTR